MPPLLRLARNKGHTIYGGHVVLIFDECHRSQFGDMHVAIEKAFKRYHLLGFTGTPIFAENAAASGNPRLRITEQAFGDRLRDRHASRRIQSEPWGGPPV